MKQVPLSAFSEERHYELLSQSVLGFELKQVKNSQRKPYHIVCSSDTQLSTYKLSWLWPLLYLHEHVLVVTHSLQFLDSMPVPQTHQAVLHWELMELMLIY